MTGNKLMRFHCLHKSKVKCWYTFRCLDQYMAPLPKKAHTESWDHGISGKANRWTADFLSSWSQQVVIEGCTSRTVHAGSGIPQGSVLFLVYIIHKPHTVGTPYNTAPYITGSNIARLSHGSQNSWSKLWIPIVKSAPVRVIFTWKSVPKKSIHGSSDIYLGTQWKQRHDSPWSYRSDVIVTFLWYGTIGIIWHRDHQSTAKKV